MPRLPCCYFTGAKAAVVVDKTVELKGGDEVLGKSVEVHFFDGRESVGHDKTRELARAVFWGKEPSPESDVVVSFELDVLTRHFDELALFAYLFGFVIGRTKR